MNFQKNKPKNWIINSVKRKSIYLKNNLYINNVPSKLKIIWLKNNNSINEYLAPLFDIKYNECFFINCVISFNNYNFNSKFDLVILDLSWQIKHVIKNCKPNTIDLNFEKTSHIFVLPLNSVQILDIKKGDFLRPMLKIN
ncbi:MAG: hypothetical protein H9897_01010 [Candidatus Ureaplasma intestinipullorum]|uniref:Uncharacterized protein n=1 Tax=Candidatus Ureaplasma intestinipullorum TaxID=2838770 RepID=A0A9E2KWH7_9BACT|nr:hypothetical protein [Candidatus Ureaplasma intestinipullorum]